MVGAVSLAIHSGTPSVDYSSDEELLAACRRRDVRAFEQLYQLHGARLKSVALHIIGNRQDAEDAVQETFVKLYKAIGGVSGPFEHRNVAVPDRDQRLLRPGPQTAAGGRAAGRRTSSAEDSGRRSKWRWKKRMKRINPRHRMVFLLFEVEGLRHAEIASILEIPEGTSKAWLFEAKKELKRILTETKR